MKHKVYLAGPITGLTYGEARESWRAQIAGLLHEDIVPYSPMRHKDYLLNDTNLDALGSNKHVLSTGKGIVARDRFDCTTADLLIVNFLGSQRASIGTCVEFGWADGARVPIITIMDLDNGNIHDHAFIRELSGFIVGSVEEAADLARRILIGGV